MTTRPNPRVRADWKRTRAEFEAASRASDEARRASARSANARYALDVASSHFPATPVASGYARRLRERYLNHVSDAAEVVTSEDYVDRHGAEIASAWVVPIYLAIAWWVLSTTIQAPFSTLATILWSAFQLVFYFFVWALVVVYPAQGIGSAISKRRLRTVLDDARTYEAWSAHVERQTDKN